MEDGTIEYWQRIGHSNNQLYRSQPFKKWSSTSSHKDFVRVVDLSPNFVVSGSRDSTVRLWKRSNGQQLSVFKSTNGPVSGIHLNESQKYVLLCTISGFIKKLHLKNDTKFEEDENFELKHGDNIDEMVMCVENDLIVSGASDSRLLIWNIKKGMASIKVFKNCAKS